MQLISFLRVKSLCLKYSEKFISFNFKNKKKYIYKDKTTFIFYYEKLKNCFEQNLKAFTKLQNDKINT